MRQVHSPCNPHVVPEGQHRDAHVPDGKTKATRRWTLTRVSPSRSGSRAPHPAAWQVPQNHRPLSPGARGVAGGSAGGRHSRPAPSPLPAVQASVPWPPAAACTLPQIAACSQGRACGSQDMLEYIPSSELGQGGSQPYHSLLCTLRHGPALLWASGRPVQNDDSTSPCYRGWESMRPGVSTACCSGGRGLTGRGVQGGTGCGLPGGGGIPKAIL